MNIIKAVSPLGNTGEIRVTLPNIDTTSAFAKIKSKFTQLKSVNDNPCQIKPGTQPSSMSVMGRGTLPDSWEDDVLPELEDSYDLSWLEQGSI